MHNVSPIPVNGPLIVAQVDAIVEEICIISCLVVDNTHRAINVAS